MKSLLSAVGFLCALIGARAQSLDSIRPLKVGDTVPDIFFSRIVHYPKSSAHLSDFKGKAVIIDVWSIYCGPCIKGLYVLDTLQQQYRESLAIMPVAEEPEIVSGGFLDARKDLSVPTFIDTLATIRKYFPYKGIPHTILIDQHGVVAAIMGAGGLKEAVADLVEGKHLNVPTKVDDLTYDPNRPLFVNGNGHIPEEDILFRSMVTAYQPTVNAVFVNTYINDKVVGFHFVNNIYPQMYLNIFQQPDTYLFSRVFRESKNGLHLYYDDSAASHSPDHRWDRENGICYDLIAPQLSKKQQFECMRSDLDKALAARHISVSWENRTIPCFVVRLKNKSLAHSMGGEPLSIHATYSDSTIMHNMPLGDYCTMAEVNCRKPVINEVKEPIQLDFQYVAKTLSTNSPSENVRFFRSFFQSKGLELLSVRRTVRVLVVRNLEKSGAGH